jgi:hypothetical protein
MDCEDKTGKILGKCDVVRHESCIEQVHEYVSGLILLLLFKLPVLLPESKLSRANRHVNKLISCL